MTINGQRLAAAAGVLAALAASSSCSLPLVLFDLGISGAWIGNLTRLAPYLEAVPGVTKATVSFKDKTATVTYDDSRVDIKSLTDATTSAGYPSGPRS